MTCLDHTHVYNPSTGEWDTIPWVPGTLERRIVELEAPGANVPKEGTPEYEAFVAELKAVVKRRVDGGEPGFDPVDERRLDRIIEDRENLFEGDCD